MTTLVPERRKGNLPAEMTRFIGRRQELSQVRDALERYRLVTLRGVGGVGKTRLALHLAVGLRRSFADGVWLAELSALRNAELLARTVAASLGLPDQAPGDPVDLLADHLAERHLLLILDTCEHLVGACAKLAEALLGAAPRLRILATSREPLDVRGEQALLISPLEVPDSDEAAAGSDAVALFADRAEAMMPGFTLTAANQQPVVQLCRRLDGIPLALELAAVRLRAMSIEQIVARLDDRFLLLGTTRSSEDRHQTLRAAIDWSHELCTAQEQRLWARLSVFPGGFDLEAAERVCAGEPLTVGALFDTLGRLVEKSIVVCNRTGAGTGCSTRSGSTEPSILPCSASKTSCGAGTATITSASPSRRRPAASALSRSDGWSGCGRKPLTCGSPSTIPTQPPDRRLPACA